MKQLCTLLIVVFGITSNYGQKLFEDVRSYPTQMQSRIESDYLPSEYRKLRFDVDEMFSYLTAAPSSYTGGRNELTIELPMPNGTNETFYIWEAPCMKPGISARYPMIKSYKGYNADQSMITRFDLTPAGFHASVRTKQGEVYIDPYSDEDKSLGYSYYIKNHQEPTDNLLSCGVSGSQVRHTHDEDQQLSFNREGEIDMHVFDMALACTGEWGSNRSSVADALGDMVTSVNRLNQIYENEFASRLILIDNNDKLIQMVPGTDPYPNATEGRALLGINTNVINNILGGNSGYDLGHVYTVRCSDVGGVAFLGAICRDANKGGGVTCHSGSLERVTVQVAAHEIGHQLSAQHTFNNCPDGMGDNGNASPGNDFEPGSGSTIMSYGGLCGQNNVQGNNDDHYHFASLRQIYNHTRFDSGGAHACSDKIPTTNIPPVVSIPYEDDFSIPINTPFVLTGEATDENGDNLTYSWEQSDAGNTGYTLGSPNNSAPLFRVYPPNESPTRFFPNENRILSNIGSNTEISPFYEREISFTFVARDNNPEGGIADWDNLDFKVDATAGPFLLKSPNAGDNFEFGQELMVEWDVANTDNDKVNCQEIDIYFVPTKSLLVENMILLACSTPNDGSEMVVMPNVPTAQGRIMVKASNNIFFDISNFNLSLKAPAIAAPYFDMDVCKETYCLPSTSQITINSAGLSGYAESINISVEDLPVGVEAVIASESINPGESTTIDINASNETKSGLYNIKIVAEGTGGQKIIRDFVIDVTSTDFNDLASIYPTNGQQETELIPDFIWAKAFNATSYEIEVATSPLFTEEDMEATGVATDTTYSIGRTLPLGKVYYWRVKAINACGESEFSEVKAFGTRVLACTSYSAIDLPQNISQSGKPTIESLIPIASKGKITDLNVLSFALEHDNLKDLTATMVSPAGTEVILFSNECPKRVTLDASFDDDGARVFSCATNVPQQFRPSGMLADFNEEDTEGIWKVIVSDNNSGAGGALEGFTMEICGSVSVEPPFIINNEILQIQPSNKPYIRTQILKAEDANNNADELRFTLVSNVTGGELLLDGVTLALGETFTQRDIDNGKLQYIHGGVAAIDAFDFLVEDGEGGWAGIERFEIEIDASFPSSTNEPEVLAGVTLTPNPASNVFTIELSDQASTLSQLTISDIEGRLIKTQTLQSTRATINVANLSNGIYLVKLTDGKQTAVKKLVVQK